MSRPGETESQFHIRELLLAAWEGSSYEESTYRVKFKPLNAEERQAVSEYVSDRMKWRGIAATLITNERNNANFETLSFVFDAQATPAQMETMHLLARHMEEAFNHKPLNEIYAARREAALANAGMSPA